MVQGNKLLDETASKVAVNANRAKNGNGQQEWMKSMGVSFVDVWFYHRSRKEWIKEPQVEDHDTFLECVDMALGRNNANWALWKSGPKRWELLDKATGDTRSFKQRQQAEMVVIHVRR